MQSSGLGLRSGSEERSKSGQSLHFSCYDENTMPLLVRGNTPPLPQCRLMSHSQTCLELSTCASKTQTLDWAASPWSSQPTSRFSQKALDLNRT